MDKHERRNVEARDLEASGISGRFLNSYYVMLKHRGAKDGFTGIHWIIRKIEILQPTATIYFLRSYCEKMVFLKKIKYNELS